jgi:UDP-glucose 4-epimerase
LDNFSVGTTASFTEALGTEQAVITTGDLTDWSNKIEIIKGDVKNTKDVIFALEGADCVVHLAANTGVQPSIVDPMADAYTNVIGTLNVLEACRAKGVGKLIFASSGAPLGEQIPPLHEGMAPRPVSPYGASKMSGEGYCSAYYHSFGIETVALRFGNVYGPGSLAKESVVAKFIRQALAGEDIVIYGDGNQTRDFIFIDDLTDAIIKSIVTNGIGGEIFQIATQAETTVSEIALRVLEAMTNRKLKSHSALQYAELPRGDVTRNYSDTKKARRFLNWSAKVCIDKGVAETLDYFIDKVR